jgi:hypothetical protein
VARVGRQLDRVGLAVVADVHGDPDRAASGLDNSPVVPPTNTDETRDSNSSSACRSTTST